MEAYIGERQLVKTAQDQGIIKVKEGISALTAKANAGSKDAQLIFKEAGQILGRTLAGVVNVLDPEIVIILGEGVEAWQHWSQGFDSALRASLVPSKRELAIGVESWRDDSWARGAACLVLATPFDETGIAGQQGVLVRVRLRATKDSIKIPQK